MFDFTSTNYMYESYENDLILRDALRDCKSEEEKDRVIKQFMGGTPVLSVLTMLSAFIVALIFCGIISLFA